MCVARQSNSQTKLRRGAGFLGYWTFLAGLWLGLAVSAAHAQDQTFDSISGGALQVSGNLSVGNFTFTHTYSNSTQATGALFLPNASTIVTLGGSVTFGNVTVSGNTTSEGDVSAGSLYTPVASFANIAFQDDNDEASGTVYLGALSFVQGNGQMSFGANGILSLTNNSTGNNLMINPADFTIHLSGVNSGVISLLGAAASVTRYSSTNLALDFSNSSLPYIQFFSPQSSSILEGNGSAATLNFSQWEGGGVTVSPTSQTISFSNGFVLSGNSTSMPFGGRSVAIGGNANASGNGAVAIGAAAANGNLALALGYASYASANGAVALAGGNATGGNSLAVGDNAVATAMGASALGPGTLAQNWGVVVFGYNNQGLAGNASAWSANDPAFIVGDGAGVNGGRGNAIVIFNNGNVSFGGPVNLTNSTSQLQINGPAILNGQATFSGKMILLQSQGDVSMGNYTN